jgi:hypothetical protein
MIAKTNISTIIAESKFLPEEHLQSLLRTIISITEGYSAPIRRNETFDGDNSK